MPENNCFLASSRAATFGGGGVIEDPRAVENIVFQTRAAPPTAFEARLAEDLMAVFGGGAVHLAEVVRGLNEVGSIDPHGLAWTEQSLAAQLRDAGDALFATIGGSPNHG